MESREFLDEAGRSIFGRWFAKLDNQTAAKVDIALRRLEAENLSNAKSVGAGVHELKIDYGPGYRVYFGNDGARLVILLGGGTKSRQSEDIRHAQAAWRVYQKRKGE